MYPSSHPDLPSDLLHWDDDGVHQGVEEEPAQLTKHFLRFFTKQVRKQSTVRALEEYKQRKFYWILTVSFECPSIH